MRHPLICQWLELSVESWPPDHYTLLGLERGESRLEQIEEHVHQRLLTLRQYQLSHPEHATEAMNCIARAFMCLTDAEAKKTYDASLPARPAEEKPPRPPMPTPDRAPESGKTRPHSPAPAAKAPAAEAERPARTEPAPAPGKSEENRQPNPDQAKRAAREAPSGDKQVDPIVKQPANDGNATKPEPAPRADTKPAVLDWAESPPPPRLSAATETATTDSDDELDAESTPTAPDKEPILMSEPADPVLETARSSKAARRGLGTRSALYERVLITRDLLHAWDQAGKFLNKPRRRLTRKTEAKELLRALRELRDTLRQFPPLVGKAGQPGYLVSALARQAMILPTFRGLSNSQREALARDWQSARTLIWLHRSFLLDELRRSRRRSALGRAWRALTAPIVDHPLIVWLLLLLVLLNVAAWLYIYW
ncbi:MAG: hypothetical protein AB7K24_22595 [Gemmataceae bacterium]